MPRPENRLYILGEIYAAICCRSALSNDDVHDDGDVRMSMMMVVDDGPNIYKYIYVSDCAPSKQTHTHTTITGGFGCHGLRHVDSYIFVAPSTS